MVLSTRSASVHRIVERSLQANPPGHVRVSQAPGEERQSIYWPQAAIADNFRFTIDGPMEVGRGEHPGVPDIALLQVDELERWFLLPDRAQGRDIHWQTRRAGTLFVAERRRVPPAPGVSAYKVSGEPFAGCARGRSDTVRP